MTVQFIDEEAIFPCMDEKVREWRKKFMLIGAKFEWFCYIKEILGVYLSRSYLLSAWLPHSVISELILLSLSLSVLNRMDEKVREWRKKFMLIGAKFEWFCLEVKHYNCFNELSNDETFICWDRYTI